MQFAWQQGPIPLSVIDVIAPEDELIVLRILGRISSESGLLNGNLAFFKLTFRQAQLTTFDTEQPQRVFGGHSNQEMDVATRSVGPVIKTQAAIFATEPVQSMPPQIIRPPSRMSMSISLVSKTHVNSHFATKPASLCW